MKSILFIILLSISSIANSEEVSLPNLAKPAYLNEGTDRVIDEKELAALIPWAKDSKALLEKMLDDVTYLKSSEKASFLENNIKNVILKSAPANNELRMRYVLNRALLIGDLIKQETNKKDNHVTDVLVDLYVLASKFALKYTDQDIENSSTKKEVTNNFAEFGKEFVIFGSEIAKSIIDISAQFKTYKTILEMYCYDLFRDLNNKKYATQIITINNTLRTIDGAIWQTPKEEELLSQLKSLRRILVQQVPEVQADKAQHSETQFISRIMKTEEFLNCSKFSSSLSDPKDFCVGLGNRLELFKSDDVIDCMETVKKETGVLQAVQFCESRLGNIKAKWGKLGFKSCYTMNSLNMNNQSAIDYCFYLVKDN